MPREPPGIAQALRRLLVSGLITIGILALVCEGLAVTILIRTIATLAQILAHLHR